MRNPGRLKTAEAAFEKRLRLLLLHMADETDQIIAALEKLSSYFLSYVLGYYHFI